jgi:hypothetical protein
MWAPKRRGERRVADQIADDRSEATAPRSVAVSERRLAKLEALLVPFSHCASLLLLP